MRLFSNSHPSGEKEFNSYFVEFGVLIIVVRGVNSKKKKTSDRGQNTED